MSEQENKLTLVGVYGSLRKGLSNHRFLENAEFVGMDALPDEYDMVSLGGFPGVLKGGSTSIVLELYAVNEEELASLDMLEGNGSFYTRETVPTVGGSTPWVYLLPRERYISEDIVESGDWYEYKMGEVSSYADI